MKNEITSSIQPAAVGTQPFRVVLRKIKPDEWATHLENLTPEGKSKPNRDLFWGTYHCDKISALKDYIRRCERCKVSPEIIS